MTKFKTSDAQRMELAKILIYGLQWLSDSSEGNEEYCRGGVETLGQIAASWICQLEFDGKVGIGTGIAMDELGIAIPPDASNSFAEMKGRIDKFISGIHDGGEVC